jgi:hypothetical protein
MVRNFFMAFLGMLLLAAPAVAQTVDLNSLPADKVQQIQQIVGDARKTTDNLTNLIDPSTVNDYAEMGRAVGIGIANAAREIGVTVAEFSDTLPGKVALFLLVYNLGGAEIASSVTGTLFGIVWIIVFIALWYRIYSRVVLKPIIETQTIRRAVKDDTGKATGEHEDVTTVVERPYDHSNGEKGAYQFFFVVIFFIGVAIGLFAIFG